jgi:hypothetical protein
MQIKTTLRFYLTPVRMAIIKGNNNNKCGKDVVKEDPYILLVGMSICTVYGKRYRKLKIELPYDPVISLLGIYPKERMTEYSRDTCTPMFIVALFIITNFGNKPTTLQLMNGSRKCGVYTQWSFTQP